jgi:hypothetical protein
VSRQLEELLQVGCRKMKMLRSKSLKTARSWTVKLRPSTRNTRKTVRQKQASTIQIQPSESVR